MDTGNFKEVFTSDETKQLRKRIEELTACKWPDAYTVIPVEINGELHATSVPISNEIKMLREQLEAANAGSCPMCDYYSAENKKLSEQLAAHEAVIKQMREALEKIVPYRAYNGDDWPSKIAQEAIDLQPTTEHLDAYVKGLLGEPSCWMTPDGEGWRMRLEPPTTDVPLGWTPLYTFKEQK